MARTLYKLKPEQILFLIQQQDLKHWWVAEVSGVHKTTLRRWLKGRIGKASGTHLRRLAAVLQTPLAQICHLS